VQTRLTRRFVEELRDFDNVYYEICNEPYFGGVTLAWQHHIAEVIADAQRGHGSPKLISRNVANHKARVTDPHPALSVFNFHYATPPDAVAMNWHLNKPIGDNETGFKGTNDAPYRIEAWEFILAGGALFNHLDYSFVAGHEDGTFIYPAKQPGGGNPGFRKQMRVLSEFIHGFEFLRLQPDTNVIRGPMPKDVTPRVLARAGRAYAAYFKSLKGQAEIEAVLPAGRYRAEWINPLDGATAGTQDLEHVGGACRIRVPAVPEDIALRILAR
jgi:hypothetical protein